MNYAKDILQKTKMEWENKSQRLQKSKHFALSLGFVETMTLLEYPINVGFRKKARRPTVVIMKGRPKIGCITMWRKC